MALIEREAAIAAIRENGTLSGGYHSDTEIEDSVVDMLENLPTVDVAPVMHGHIVGSRYSLHCSNCGDIANIGDNYCPSCGARMDGDEEYGPDQSR